MKSKRWTVLLVLVMLMMIAGCASNPKGGFGPSWDVPMKVPLAQEETKTIEEFLEDAPEEVQIPSGSQELIYIEDTINEGDKVKKFTVGEDLLTEVNNQLPQINQSVDLEPITVDNIADNISRTVPVTSGVNDGSLTGFALDYGSSFSSVTFSDSGVNKLEVIVDNKSTSVKIDRLTLSLMKPDGQGGMTKIDEIQYTDIAAGTASTTQAWDLSNQVLPGSGAEVDLTATTLGSGNGDMDVTVSFPDSVEIAKVTDLQSPNINEEINFDPLTYDNFEAGVEKVLFSQGSLGVNIDPTNQFGGLDFAVSDLQIGTLGGSNSGSIDLTNGELDLTTGVTIDFNLVVSNNSSTLSYDSTESVEVRGGFSNAEVESVDLDATEFRELTNADLGLAPDGEFDLGATILGGLDIPDQLEDIEVNGASLDLNVQGLNGFEVDLSSVTFEALDSTGTALKTYQPNLVATGESTTIDLTTEDSNGVNFIDLLQTPNTEDIVVTGGFDASNINATGGTTTIDTNTTVGMNSVNANIPLDFEIVSPTSEVAVASVDSVDQDDVDMIEDGVKKFEILLEEITNQFGVEIKAQVYLANLNRDYGDPDNLSDEALDNLEDLVAQEQHILEVSNEADGSFTIEATDGSPIDKQLMVDPDEADRLTGDHLYFGIKLTIPATDSVQLKTGDEVSINNARSIITTKVNQDQDNN
ncbi:hypothetical protein [Halanaerobacter jeridensis]|uniref:Uncharacterized protein n=1 Tax=Halanaerobacter jeridensis TaxID=706427 RepID=A0A938XWE9_9FIRM|nr:hypothetical protein [Halanaerobacter jeridensis]MBM7558064.1 hypothetical protein [Halanaerobacter jeridensis]